MRDGTLNVARVLSSEMVAHSQYCGKNGNLSGTPAMRGQQRRTDGHVKLVRECAICGTRSPQRVREKVMGKVTRMRSEG